MRYIAGLYFPYFKTKWDRLQLQLMETFCDFTKLKEQLRFEHIQKGCFQESTPVQQLRYVHIHHTHHYSLCFPPFFLVNFSAVKTPLHHLIISVLLLLQTCTSKLRPFSSLMDLTVLWSHDVLTTVVQSLWELLKSIFLILTCFS